MKLPRWFHWSFPSLFLHCVSGSIPSGFSSLSRLLSSQRVSFPWLCIFHDTFTNPLHHLFLTNKSCCLPAIICLRFSFLFFFHFLISILHGFLRLSLQCIILVSTITQSIGRHVAFNVCICILPSPQHVLPSLVPCISTLRFVLSFYCTTAFSISKYHYSLSIPPPFSIDPFLFIRCSTLSLHHSPCLLVKPNMWQRNWGNVGRCDTPYRAGTRVVTSP